MFSAWKKTFHKIGVFLFTTFFTSFCAYYLLTLSLILSSRLTYLWHHISRCFCQATNVASDVISDFTFCVHVYVNYHVTYVITSNVIQDIQRNGVKSCVTSYLTSFVTWCMKSCMTLHICVAIFVITCDVILKCVTSDMTPGAKFVEGKICDNLYLLRLRINGFGNYPYQLRLRTNIRNVTRFDRLYVHDDIKKFSFSVAKTRFLNFSPYS